MIKLEKFKIILTLNNFAPTLRVPEFVILIFALACEELVPF